MPLVGKVVCCVCVTASLLTLNNPSGREKWRIHEAVKLVMPKKQTASTIYRLNRIILMPATISMGGSKQSSSTQ